MGAYGHPLVWKACFVCVVYVQGAAKHHPNIWGHLNIWGCPSIQGASKHRDSQTYRDIKHMGVSKHTGRHMRYPNIQRPSKHMGASQHTGGIQTYGGIQNYGAYGHPLSLTKHAFFVSNNYLIHLNKQNEKPTSTCFLCVVYVQGASKHMGHPYVWIPPECVWTLPYVWMPPYVWKMFGCPLYIHNTKKACFVTLRECPYAPYIWMPHMFGCPNMFGYPLYVWMPPMFGCYLYVWAPPVCLDAHMFGHSLYVWIMFGCPLYIYNTKKACFVTLRECPYAPIHLDAPCMIGCPSCLDTPIGLNTLLYVWVMFGCPLYIHNT